YWNEDSVEFYLNASGKLGATAYEKGIVQFTFPAVNITSDKLVVAGINNTFWDVTTLKAVKTATGYVIEASVPLKTSGWDIKLAHGTVVGFQAHLNAASSKDRETKLIWGKADTADASWQNPSLFGRLAFFKVGETTTPRVETGGAR
ncbi:MAG TPA: sugar-binding protein, partial [Deinococcales bacterium]|nr:sugar-binding protein [Deinococcales bacterium]